MLSKGNILQKNAKHPCVVDTLGGYWPDPEDVEEEEEIEPWIVMERMNYNLIQVLDTPEAFSKSAQQGSKRARDIWSFGVLICEVLIPNFLLNIVNRHPEGVHAITGSGQFANEIAETVRIISWEGDLRDCAVSCLSLEPKDRPTIDDVLDKLREPCVIS